MSGVQWGGKIAFNMSFKGIITNLNDVYNDYEGAFYFACSKMKLFISREG